METWADRIEDLVRRGFTGAIPFSRVLQSLEREGIAVEGRETWLLQRLQERSDRFRLVPDRLGPWTRWPEPRPAPGLPIGGGHRDPWIVLVEGERRTFIGAGEFLVGRVQDSLRAWGLELDEASQVSVARWIGANGEAEKVLNALINQTDSGR